MATKGMAAGRLRHRITIKQQVTTIDTSGEQVTDWEVVDSGAADQKFWCEIAPLSARELLASEQVASEVTARILMRYDSRIKAQMRAEHDDGQTTTIYNLAPPIRDPDSGLEWCTIPCNALLNQG
jgi:SPP1 family predicted phage head-tail adaptor